MIDSHCHIAGPEFVQDLAAVIERARHAKLTHALVILAADDAAEIAQGQTVAQAWDAVRFSIGVHPHAAGKFAAESCRCGESRRCRHRRAAARAGLGEIGLDYHYDFAPREVQQQVFREQIRLAKRRSLPIVIHTREAEDDTFRILDEETAS